MEALPCPTRRCASITSPCRYTTQPGRYHFYSEVLQLPLVDALSGDDWGGKPWLMMFFGTGSGQLLALSALHGAQPPRPDGLPE